jgi:hypothetical protein
MLRRKDTTSPVERRREPEIDVDDLPKFDDELSPREAMARLTNAIERKIDASFGRKPKIHNE